MSDIFDFVQGSRPLLISMPHVGTRVPPEISERFTQEAAALPDTDWHVDRLYDFAEDLGASVLRAKYSRYVIDLNRAPDGQSLYPGARNTELCPTTTFGDRPIYASGQALDLAELPERRETFWRPYHAKLGQELAELKRRHGRALLWDAHSIHSRVPRFFEGKLPDLNIGTAAGTSAHPETARRVAEAAQGSGYSQVLDGRFKGGYITRAYGTPADGTEAIQLELSWATYMNEGAPYAFREDLAQGIRPVLKAMIEAALG
jgi:N-formylglutamate deformylase